MEHKSINPFAGVQATNRKGEPIVEFTTENLFTNNNPHGYLSREELVEYVSPMTAYQRKKLVMFFENIAAGYPVSSLPIPMEEEDGSQILWVNFKINGHRQSFRMFAKDWLVELMKDYNVGKFHGFQFSPEIMAAELKKVQDDK